MKRKRLLVSIALCLFLGASAVYASTTHVHERQGHVELETLLRTGHDWRACQHNALMHLSAALQAYPNARQYTVRWSDRRLFPSANDYDYFEVIYDWQHQTLTENNVGNATMDTCRHVTDHAIQAVARTSGGFKSFANYGGDYSPL